ncbi:MAG: hypothetical protein ACR2LK_03550 [Solirubrobacteraceae bacterium]
MLARPAGDQQPLSRPSRRVPLVGMDVAIVHLGVSTPAIVEEVRDGGRTIIAGGETFTLSRLTAHFVRAGDPYYGVRLALSPDAGRAARDNPD